MRKIVYLAAALPLLVACNNKGAEEVQQPLTPFEKGQQLSITSQPINDYERSMARKVHVREEVTVEKAEVCSGDTTFVTRLLWDAGDQIDVFVDDSIGSHLGHAYPKSVFTLTSGANTSEGTFSGTMPASGTAYAIMYPHRAETTVEDYTEGQTFPYKVTQFSMPAVQTYRSPAGNTFGSQDWPTFASGLLPIFGKGDLDNGFETYPCGGAMRFKLWSANGDTVQTIRLAAKNDSGVNLTGSFMINPTGTGSEIMNMIPKTGGSGRHAVVLKMPDNFTMPKTEEDAVWIYFVLPAPLTFTGGFGIYTYKVAIDDPEASGATETHSFVTTKTPQIKQNHITTIVFGDSNDKGNKGNINGKGWDPNASE